MTNVDAARAELCGPVNTTKGHAASPADRGRSTAGRRARRGLGALALLACGAAFAASSGCDGDNEGSPAGAAGAQGQAGGGGQAGGAGGAPGDPARVESRLLTTLEELAAFGEKQAGTAAGRLAGDYVKARFERAGLAEVVFEEFNLNGHDVASSSLAFTATAGGQARPLPMGGHKVFSFSGAGALEAADVVDVGDGQPDKYVAPVEGKVVLVKTSQTYHRSIQLQTARERGAVALIATSTSPSNLVQIGGVLRSEFGIAPLPALSIGAADGEALRAAIATPGQTVKASLQVEAAAAPRRGRNVIGRLRRPGSLPGDPYILVGAHYDSWSVGTIDNGTGVATMLELAETLSRGPERQYDVVFVGYDAEELGLLGGYDYLRRHVVREAAPVVAFVHLEMTGIAKAEFQGDLAPRFFVHTGAGPLDQATTDAGLRALFPAVLGLEQVAPLTGGLIPTDAQGLYWGGVDGAIAFGMSPFYHTEQDTPDKVDLEFLRRNTHAIAAFVNELDAQPPASFAPRDPALHYPSVVVDRSQGGVIKVDVAVQNAEGLPVASPWAQLQLYVDDFTTPHQGGGVPADDTGYQERIGKADGTVSFTLPASLMLGPGPHWLHVRVGNDAERYPRGERLVELP